MRRVFELTRDWRIRTIVPVIVINLLAFAGLYALMYHYAMSNLVQSQKIAADHLFDDLRLYYEDGTIEHSVTSMAARLQRHTVVHRLAGFTLFGITGEPLNAINYPRIAVMQIRFDLTQAMGDAKQRVQKKFAAAGVAWVGVLVLLFWTG